MGALFSSIFQCSHYKGVLLLTISCSPPSNYWKKRYKLGGEHLLSGSVVDRGIVEDLNKDSRGLTLPGIQEKEIVSALYRISLVFSRYNFINQRVYWKAES